MGVQQVVIEPPSAVINGTGWLRLVAGVSLVYALFHGTATVLGSDRGQWGLVIAALVVGATCLADRWVPGRRSIRDGLGLRRPLARGMTAAAGVSILLLLVPAAFAAPGQTKVSTYPGWPLLLAGLFAQAGVAEEVLFRAFLFGRVRVGRTFWRAALLSMLPFVAVHLAMFVFLPWQVAFASVLLSAIVSFPLAHLFEIGGRTIWAPALLHFVIQATPKILVFEDGAAFALIWIVASALVPLLAFAVPNSTTPFIFDSPAAR